MRTLPQKWPTPLAARSQWRQRGALDMSDSGSLLQKEFKPQSDKAKDAAARAPFISAAAPSVMLMESWPELSNLHDLTQIFQTPEHAAWRSFRDSEDACYVGLAMPRFLARQPYGAKTDPVEAFDFEEDTSAAGSKNYTWANAAYAMTINIRPALETWNRSLKENHGRHQSCCIIWKAEYPVLSGD